jgi:TPP-dependent 2-oxoacid decarboxylase
VVCLAGDGCLQMTIQELSTARQYGADIIVVIANNGRYGTIRMHQENHYPGRVSGTELFNPDYVQLAQAYGGTGHRITETEQFGPAFEAARKGGLHLIELVLDPRMLSTTNRCQAEVFGASSSIRTSRCGNGIEMPCAWNASQSARKTLPRMLVSPPVGSLIQNRRM